MDDRVGKTNKATENASHAVQAPGGEISQFAASTPYTLIQRAYQDPRLLSPADIMALQGTIGNRAVQRILAEIRPQHPTTSKTDTVIQPKMQVGPADDPFERQADQVAEQVIQQTDAPAQRRAVVHPTPLLQSAAKSPHGVIQPKLEGAYAALKAKGGRHYAQRARQKGLHLHGCQEHL